MSESPAGAADPADEGSHWESVLRLGLRFPEVEEGRSYGMRALRVRKRFFTWMHGDGEVLAVRTHPLTRPYLLASDPEVYFITEHYRNYPSVLIRLSRVRTESLRDALAAGWAMVAPKQLVAEFEASSPDA